MEQTGQHIPKMVPVASGAGRIVCSCGWKSGVEDDGDMFDPNRYRADDAFRLHVEAPTRDAKV